MATAGDIITAAFLKVGVDSPTTAQTASALISLNNMISAWSVEFLAPVPVRTLFTEYAATSSTLILPADYKDALVYNLAVALSEDWDRVISKTTHDRAMETKAFLSTQAMANAVPNVKYNVLLGNSRDSGQ